MKIVTAAAFVQGNWGALQTRLEGHLLKHSCVYWIFSQVIQNNWNKIFELIVIVTISIYYLFDKEAICFIFTLFMYLSLCSTSSRNHITRFPSLQYVHFYSLIWCTQNALQQLCMIIPASISGFGLPRGISKRGCMSVGFDGCHCRLEFWLQPLTNFMFLAKSLKISKDSFSSFLKKRISIWIPCWNVKTLNNNNILLNFHNIKFA